MISGPMTKAELRKLYVRKRRELSAADRAELSRRIFDRFFGAFDLSSTKFLHCYIAIEKFGEIDTTIAFRRLWHEFPDVVTAVPRVDKDSGELRHLKFTPDTELVQNVWGIHEPAHDEYIEDAKFDLVLVPLLCFDEAGHRVGYGKGYYDRFLSRCRPDCLKVGLSFFPALTGPIDAHESDYPLDFCVTPERIYDFTQASARPSPSGHP